MVWLFIVLAYAATVGITTGVMYVVFGENTTDSDELVVLGFISLIWPMALLATIGVYVARHFKASQSDS